jgi:hypothetical protein
MHKSEVFGEDGEKGEDSWEASQEVRRDEGSKQISVSKEYMSCPNCINISTKQPWSSHEVMAKIPRSRTNKSERY